MVLTVLERYPKLLDFQQSSQEALSRDKVSKEILNYAASYKTRKTLINL